MDIDTPYGFDSRGGTKGAALDEHLREMLELLIFTAPGERVNRPDFGSGLLQLLFAPNSPELAATVQFTLQAAIQRWLGDVLEVRELTVRAEDSSIAVDVTYFVRSLSEQRSATFTHRP